MKAKKIGMTGAAVLCVILGMSGPGFGGHDHQDNKHDQAKPEKDSHDQARLSQKPTRQPQRQKESGPQPRDQHPQPDRAR
jgi:hypothetical protein